MAEFCNKCAQEMGFAEPEIDVYAIAENELSPGMYMPVLCEGCSMVAVGVGEDERTMLAYPTGETAHNADETLVDWIYIEEYESGVKHNQIKN